MNYWYVSTSHEILVDMDKPRTSIPHAERRLKGAMIGGQLSVFRVETHESFSPDHVHVLITLRESLSLVDRIVWGMIFHGDIYRGCTSLMRAHHGVGSPDLLITPSRFLRTPDATCNCPAKHDAKIMDVCPVAINLRGDARLRSFFGVPMHDDDERALNKERIIDLYGIWPNNSFSSYDQDPRNF